MNRFVIVALLVMAWAYWELSGGAGFTPEPRTVAGAPEAEPEPAPEPAQAAPAAPAPDLEATLEPPPAATTPADEAAEELQIEAAVEDAEADAAPAFAQNPLTSAPEPAAEPAPEPVPAGRALHVVTGSRVNLREGPGTSFAAVGHVTEGMILDVLEIRDGWAYVELQSGDQGWMSASFLAPLDG
ncbi:MAG: SH3 domain-containing protein [Rubellimicrobium sp.]|nr:SH3 domain-containing protein [Rubellimicrobium sp.]